MDIETYIDLFNYAEIDVEATEKITLTENLVTNMINATELSDISRVYLNSMEKTADIKTFKLLNMQISNFYANISMKKKQ